MKTNEPEALASKTVTLEFDEHLAELDRIRANHTDSDVYAPQGQRDVGLLLAFIDNLWLTYTLTQERADEHRERLLRLYEVLTGQPRDTWPPATESGT
jgi:hypothetical protein